MPNIIKVNNLEKKFGQNLVLKDINMEVQKGEVVTIIGSSGSGKSTLLRCLNLLEEPTSGEILYKNENILDKKFDLRAYRTKVGMVFQNFNLFENKTVLQNCTLSQEKVLKISKKDAEEKAIPTISRHGPIYKRKAITNFWWAKTKSCHSKSPLHGSRSITFR